MSRTETDPAPRAPARLSITVRRALLCGVGSIGRPLALELAHLGLSDLTIVDPKHYAHRSVVTQCDPEDVHQPKVDVVAAILRQSGLCVVSHMADICDLPDGVVRERAILISCTDNTRALIRTNRLAARMQSPLLKVCIEPQLDCVSVRAYRPCSEERPCAECQLSDRHYEGQVHPDRCDSAVTARRTAGPRALAEAAAQLAWRAARDILDAGPAADQWFDFETRYERSSGRLTRSRLERYAACRWDHSVRWVNMFRLVESPAELRLEQLVPPTYRSALGAVTFAFDGSVARWACCSCCSRRVRLTRWVTSVSCGVGTCPACGSLLVPFPHGVRQQLPGLELRDVLGQPLAAWGVAPGAVIQVTTGNHVRAFVVSEPCGPPQVATRADRTRRNRVGARLG